LNFREELYVLSRPATAKAEVQVEIAAATVETAEAVVAKAVAAIVVETPAAHAVKAEVDSGISLVNAVKNAAAEAALVHVAKAAATDADASNLINSNQFICKKALSM
jgi:hypothetical protein